MLKHALGKGGGRGIIPTVAPTNPCESRRRSQRLICYTWTQATLPQKLGCWGQMPQPVTVETCALVRELRGPVTLFPAGKFNVNGACQNTWGRHPNGETGKKGKNPQKGACPKSKPDPKWDGQPTKKGPLAFPPGRYSLQVKQKKSTTQIYLQNPDHTNEKRKSTKRARSPLQWRNQLLWAEPANLEQILRCETKSRIR